MWFKSCGGGLDKTMLSVNLCLSSVGWIINMYTAIKSTILELNEVSVSAVAMFSKKIFYCNLQTSYVKSLAGRLHHNEQKIPEATVLWSTK